MIQEQINKLIPYISSDFLTYPLWEEGNYTPFINFWHIGNDKKLPLNFNSDINLNDEYIIELEEKRGTINNYRIFPNYEYDNSGGFDYIKKDWSI